MINNTFIFISKPQKLNHSDEINHGFYPKKRIKSPRYSSPSSPSSSAVQILSKIEPPPNLLPSKTDLLKLIAVMFVAAFVAIGCNYVVTVFNRQPKPFCDSDTESEDFLSDVCQPCPSHGICYEGKLECISGYRKHGNACLEDGNINEMAKKLAKLVESHVCESYSQFLCKGMGRVWVHGDELWNNVDRLKLTEDNGKNNGIYVYAKQKATEMVDILLETRESSIGIKELKCPELLVEHYKPLSCCIRLWVLDHAFFLLPFCAMLLGCTWILLKVRRRSYLSVRAGQLYEEVCDTLEETALISRSVNGEGEPWVVASFLRDHLLTPRERRDPLLWKKVEELVQEDSRVDRYPKKVKGESKVVWEWQVEGPLRSSGKKKKKSKEKVIESRNLGFNEDPQTLKTEEPSYG